MRTAIQIEFAPKGTDRLRRIVRAYEFSGYEQTVFLVKSVALGQRIRSLAVRRPLFARADEPVRPKVRAAAWPALPDDARKDLDAALSRAA